MTTAQSTQPDITVSTVEQLVDAVHGSNGERIIVDGHLREVPSICLAPGLTVAGADDAAGITFASGSDGLQHTADNSLRHLSLHTAPERRAVFNDTELESLGRITRLVDAGQLKIAAVRTYPLEQATDALEQLEHGHVRGKVVLWVA
jgi:NADPH:quinone reductase-like Zn-dependent oxidoreductase